MDDGYRGKNFNCPEHNMCYIAVNDVVDTSEQKTADFMPFRNIINELYAKHTFKTVKSAKCSRVRTTNSLVSDNDGSKSDYTYYATGLRASKNVNGSTAVFTYDETKILTK